MVAGSEVGEGEVKQPRNPEGTATAHASPSNHPNQSTHHVPTAYMSCSGRSSLAEYKAGSRPDRDRSGDQGGDIGLRGGELIPSP